MMRRKRQSVRVNEAKKDMVLREEGKDVIIFGSIRTYILLMSV
jgi:hypothetical protein